MGILDYFRGARSLDVKRENIGQDSPKIVRVQVAPEGTSGIEVYSGYFSEEYLDTLTGSKAADIYDQMRRSDSEVKMAISAVKNPILGASWLVEANPDMGEEGEKHAALIDHILFSDTERPFTEFLAEALTVTEFGHAVFEIVHKIVQNHEEFGNYVGLAQLGWRSPKTLEQWHIDPVTSRVQSINQVSNGDQGVNVLIPGEFLLVITLGKEGDNYEGVSMLRPCYGPYIRKRNFQKFMAAGTEKFAIPTPIMHIPDGQENSQQYTNAIAALEAYTSHQKNYITLPSGWELELTNNPFDPDKVQVAIDAEDKAIKNAFLANFLGLGQGATGSYALSNDLSDFFLTGIEHIAYLIAGRVNQKLIPDLVRLNFGPQKAYPKLKVSGISDKAGKELAEIYSSLVDAGAITPTEKDEVHLRDRYGFPEMDKDSARQAPGAPGMFPVEQSAQFAEQYSFGPGMEMVAVVVVSKKVAPDEDKAIELAKKLGCKKLQAEETEETYRFRQATDGVTIVVGQVDEPVHEVPESVLANIEKGKELSERWGRGGSEKSLQLAERILEDGAASRKDIGKIAQFARNKKHYRPETLNSDDGPTAGTIAYLIWGGDEGIQWASSIVNNSK